VLLNAVATENEFQSYLASFIQVLRQLGWAEGQNLPVDVRWNAGDAAAWTASYPMKFDIAHWETGLQIEPASTVTALVSI